MTPISRECDLGARVAAEAAVAAVVAVVVMAVWKSAIMEECR